MKTLHALLLLAMLTASNIASAIEADDLGELIREEHPRILITSHERAGLWKSLKEDPFMIELARDNFAAADEIIELEPVVRKKTGRRLLSVSRTCLKRIICLGMAYQLSAETRYARRAEDEMLAAADFSDWNPSHFLDVAEMTAALAIGYDWFYDELPERSRNTIRDAIVEMGLKPSRQGKHWWKSADNNWNQVCNAGMVLGALAIFEYEPELAARIVADAIESIPIAMREYAPDGAYPEGPGYWVYGTSFNVLMLAALDSALGTDFGLSKQPGFMQSSDFFLHASGPSGLFFNYSDCGERSRPAAIMYWFSRKRGAPHLIWSMERDLTRRGKAWTGDGDGDRLLPLTLLWREAEPKIAAPTRRSWSGGGKTPVAFHRSSWTDPNAVYIGIKGGSPHTNHAHMDIGSFVMDAGGVRWAIDLGAQSYHSLESKGVNLWQRKQDGERWTIFRYINASHNTLVIDGQPQLVAGHAPLTDGDAEPPVFSSSVDMSPVYAGQLELALRTVELREDGLVSLKDRIKAGADGCQVRWGMATRAEIAIVSDRKALLQQAGKTLEMRIASPRGASFQKRSIENPPRDYDARNPGCSMVLIELDLPAQSDCQIAVEMELRK